MTKLDPKDCSPSEWLGTIKPPYRSAIDQMIANNAGSYISYHFHIMMT